MTGFDPYTMVPLGYALLILAGIGVLGFVLLLGDLLRRQRGQYEREVRLLLQSWPTARGDKA